MHEDKQKILNLLLPALQATSNLDDLHSLKYDPERETVTASFLNGAEKIVNVAMDSGTSMIKDILDNII